MKINVLTLFPEMFSAVTGSILGKAAEKGLLEFNFINIRDFSNDKHKKADDYPFGGGAGMLMTPQPIYDTYKQRAANDKAQTAVDDFKKNVKKKTWDISRFFWKNYVLFHRNFFDMIFRLSGFRKTAPKFFQGGNQMKKIASLLLCMVLLLSVCCVNASAAENACIGAGVTVAEDGTVTVAVSAKAAAANARLTLGFDADRLTYTGCETAFAVATVKAETDKLTIGLASSTAKAAAAGEELVKLTCASNDPMGTQITVTAENGAQGGAAAMNKSDPTKLSKEDRAEIRRRVRNGEKIVF